MTTRAPIEHRVKSWCHLFAAFIRGDKTHDLRIMDRDYQVGDTLTLCEYDKQTERYTGREARALITYITSPDHVACAFSPTVLGEGFAILSIQPILQGGRIVTYVDTPHAR